MDQLLKNIQETLPVTNPVLIFSIVLFVLLLAPTILNRIKIPRIVGLILSGVLLGENCLGVLTRDSSFELFGTVGLIYIMFLAGLELNLTDFRKRFKESFTFGFFTFSIPMIIGTGVGFLLLSYLPIQMVDRIDNGVIPGEMTGEYYLIISSILLASMFASHTLLTYTTVGRYGVTKNRAVGVSVGGTMIATTLSLLILAVVTGMAKGTINSYFWIRLGISVMIFLVITLVGFPKLLSWFFKRNDDEISQWVFVLALVFVASWLAQLSRLEAIIGAFLAGVAISDMIPKISPLMNRLEFVGNAIFIPFFLIGVGMMINVNVIFSSTNTLIAAVVMSLTATICKYLPAVATQKIFNYTKDEGRLIFGLSNSQAAATLAAVKIGHDTIISYTDTGEMIRMFSDDILNGTIAMILITCSIAGVYTEKSCKKISMSEDIIDKKIDKSQSEDNILVALSNPITLPFLIDLAVLTKTQRDNKSIFALHVSSDNQKQSLDTGRHLLEKAARIASATDTNVRMISRYDTDVTSGIIHTMKENKISELVLGLHHKIGHFDNIYGQRLIDLVRRTTQMVVIVKCLQPYNTFKRVVIYVPDKAQFEEGFVKWYDRVKNICKQIGAVARFITTVETMESIKVLAARNKFGVETSYCVIERWETMTTSEDITTDDLVVFIQARKGTQSYDPEFDNMPSLLEHYYAGNSYIVLFPEQEFNQNENISVV